MVICLRLALQGLCMGHKCLCFDKLYMSKRGEKIMLCCKLLLVCPKSDKTKLTKV